MTIYKSHLPLFLMSFTLLPLWAIIIMLLCTYLFCICMYLH